MAANGTDLESAGEPRPRARHHGNRWGRSAEARQAVMEAVDDLLLERGFAALTIEAVAARAGVGKQTIYRWWTSKVDLLLDAFLDEVDEELPPIETGSLDSDLRALLCQLRRFFEKPSNAAMFCALAGQAQHDADTAARFRSEVIDAIQARPRGLFETDRFRGGRSSAAATEAAIEAMLSPLFYRLLVSGRPLRELKIDEIVDETLKHAGRTRSTRPPADGRRRE